MTSTISPTDGVNAQVKEESPELEDERILRIKLSDESDVDFKHHFVPLFGTPPRECPVWQSMTHKKMDVRALDAYTVRYECEKSALSSHNHAAARHAIMRRLQQLLTEDQLPQLVSIAFDEGPLNANGDRPGFIDLVFDSARVLVQVVNHLDGIQVEGRHGNQHTFSRVAFTLNLGGSILPLDCRKLPVNAFDAEALFNAFQAAFQPTGLLLGFGKLFTRSKTLNVERQGTGNTRFYLQLHEENMSIPWLELVHLLPTRVKINGLTYTLDYRGRHLHTVDVVSPNLTVARIGEAGAQAATKHRAAPSDDSSSIAAKKRRSNK